MRGKNNPAVVLSNSACCRLGCDGLVVGLKQARRKAGAEIGHAALGVAVCWPTVSSHPARRGAVSTFRTRRAEVPRVFSVVCCVRWMFKTQSDFDERSDLSSCVRPTHRLTTRGGLTDGLVCDCFD